MATLATEMLGTLELVPEAVMNDPRWGVLAQVGHQDSGEELRCQDCHGSRAAARWALVAGGARRVCGACGCGWWVTGIYTGSPARLVGWSAPKKCA